MRLGLEHLTSGRFNTGETQTTKERHDNEHGIDQENHADHNSDSGEKGTTSARLDGFLAEDSEGLEAQGTTSGNIGEMLKVVGSDLFDGIDEVAESELLDESLDLLRGHVLYRELDVSHNW